MQLTIYSRPGCHLCEEMKATVERAVRLSQQPARIDEVDVSTDAGLEAQYGVDIPVLLVDGKKAAKHRVTEEAVVKMLMARAGAAGEAG
jgi:glutaredoxin